jgi:hypothetical protein
VPEFVEAGAFVAAGAFVSAAAGAGALASAAGAAFVSVLAVLEGPELLQPVMTRGRARAARHRGRNRRDFMDWIVMVVV